MTDELFRELDGIPADKKREYSLHNIASAIAFKSVGGEGERHKDLTRRILDEFDKRIAKEVVGEQRPGQDRVEEIEHTLLERGKIYGTDNQYLPDHVFAVWNLIQEDESPSEEFPVSRRTPSKHHMSRDEFDAWLAAKKYSPPED